MKKEHHYFLEISGVMIGTNGQCDCLRDSPCPLGRTGTALRCSVEELKNYDMEQVSLRISSLIGKQK